MWRFWTVLDRSIRKLLHLRPSKLDRQYMKNIIRELNQAIENNLISVPLWRAVLDEIYELTGYDRNKPLD